MQHSSVRLADIFDVCFSGLRRLDIAPQESYKPLQVTSGVWIIPAGMDPEDSAATNIFLRPGLAFGTGISLAFGASARSLCPIPNIGLIAACPKYATLFVVPYMLWSRL